MITTRILQLVHELCSKRIHVTKRDLFYTDVKLFEVGTLCTLGWYIRNANQQEQGNSDSVLDDVACMLGCTRSSLHGV